MRFDMAENNLQFVLSTFSVNQLLETVFATDLIAIPVNHHLVAELFGIELTTTILFPIVPELFYNYGHRNVSLSIKPLTGTVVNWQDQSEQTTVQVKSLASWIIHEDATTLNSTSEVLGTNNTLIAFESLLDLDLLIALGLNQTAREMTLNIDSLDITRFNVTVDNLGGSVKNDEAGILFRLQSVEAVLSAAINHLLSSHPIPLPELNLIDYTLKFDPQDAALGVALNVFRK
jgi:hypothetical protein